MQTLEQNLTFLEQTVIFEQSATFLEQSATFEQSVTFLEKSVDLEEEGCRVVCWENTLDLHLIWLGIDLVVWAWIRWKELYVNNIESLTIVIAEMGTTSPCPSLQSMLCYLLFHYCWISLQFNNVFDTNAKQNSLIFVLFYLEENKHFTFDTLAPSGEPTPSSG